MVGVRLSQGKVNDFDYQWARGREDAAVIFPTVARAGADYIHFASEGSGYRAGSFSADNVCLPGEARRSTGLPVIANGGMHDPILSRRVLEEVEADLVALGTGALANPDWPETIRWGRDVRNLPKDYFSAGVTLEKTPALG